MAKDVRSWRQEIDEFMDEEVVGEALDVQGKIMLELLTQLVTGTPVGKRSRWKINQGKPASKHRPKGYVGGHARKNWQVTINAPAISEIPGEDKSGKAATRAGKAVIDTITEPCIGYISNLVPYIQRLDEGWSSTKTRGMVQPALNAVRRKFGLNK